MEIPRIKSEDELIKIFEQKSRITVKSPIAFVNDKLYYFVPIAKRIIKNNGERESRRKNKGGKKGKSKKVNSDMGGSKVITYLGVLGFAHGIAIYPSEFYTSDEVATENFYSKYFAHLDFDIGGVQFTFYKNQGVHLLRAVKEALFDGEQVCKSERDEIFTLVDILLYYVKYDKEITAYVIASWILGTYLFPMFNYYPYLYFRAEKGSGKGTNLTIISNTAWNPTDKFIASKEAPLFRLIEQAKPTLILDEYHRLLKNPFIGPAIESILESGSEKGGKVIRCREGDPNEIEHFDVYCPKVLASRRATEIEEKSIVIILTKTNDLKYAERRKELDYDPRFEKVKEGLLRIALSYWKEIFKAYKELKPTKNLTGREFNFWAPILAIAKVIFPEKYDEILAYAEENTRARLGERYEIEDIILTALYNHKDVLHGKTPPVTLAQLKEWTEYQLHHNTIISALTNLKLVQNAKGGKYYLRKDRLLELLEERGFNEDLEDLESESDEVDEGSDDIENGTEEALDVFEEYYS
ncbi:hypothetical protein DRP07_09245 [Archaeoglobales archaeon]|nr:MAG: hypothetical protein DRP07_09245 [Archaeoglobales archaeon]